MILIGRAQAEGRGRGTIVAIPPLSFWGGYDAETGRVIDRSHPALGHYLVAKVLVMAHGRGSSSSSSVLAEAIRLATAPAAIVLAESDPILATGAIVAQALYRRTCPIVVLGPDEYAIVTGALSADVRVEGDDARVVIP
jgi:predicted aconitase with swiveling domain